MPSACLMGSHCPALVDRIAGLTHEVRAPAEGKIGWEANSHSFAELLG